MTPFCKRSICLTSLSIVLQTIAQFFLFLSVGYIAARLGVVRASFLSNTGGLIMKVLLPAMIFSSLYSGNSRTQLLSSLPVLPLAIGFYLFLALLIRGTARLLRLPKDRNSIFQISFLFGNTGFVGLPLIASLFPGKGMICLALFSFVDQIFLWSYGISLVQQGDKRRFSLRSLLQPSTVAILLALLCLCLDLRIPALLENTVASLSRACSVLCMIYLGVMVFFAHLKEAAAHWEVYVGIAVKQLLFPLIVWFILGWINVPLVERGVFLVLSSLPTMTAVPILVKTNGGDGEYAAGTAVMTFLFSLFLIPLLFWITQL